MNEMDIDVNDLNEIDRKLNVEVSSDNDLQIICKECSEVIEDIDKLKKTHKGYSWEELYSLILLV